MITCVGQVDGSRCLLGDKSKGRPLVLFVDSDKGVESFSGSGHGFTGMKLEVLGECSTPHCLAYLNNGVVFVGSRLGDSQLVKVKSTVTGRAHGRCTLHVHWAKIRGWADIRDISITFTHVERDRAPR